MPWNEDDVAQFINFTSADVTAEEARAWLDRFDAETAAGQWWDLSGVLPGPNAVQSQQQQTQWDEAAFDADRDIYGPEPRPAEFNIQGPDQMDTQRPNSRVENWVNQSALTEADQLQMAKERSLQQSGVIDSGQHFQRVADDHQQSNFQLTSYNGMAFDMNQSEPPPADKRQRPDAETPAFVRPSSSREGHLAPLLTILHHIPLAREIMISRDRANVDYGDDPQWWNGARISNPDAATAWESASDFYKAVETFGETQRLMAALDSTDRAYISSDVLETMVNDGKSIKCELKDFFERWIEGATDPMNGESSKPMRATFVSHLDNGREKMGDTESRGESMFVLPINSDGASEDTLIGKLSGAFLEQSSTDGPVSFEHLAKVILFELFPSRIGDKVDIKVPTAFNARMFMPDPPEQFQKVFNDHRVLYQRASEIREHIESVDFARGPNGGTIPYQKLLDATIKHLAEKPTNLAVPKPAASDDLMDLDEEPPTLDGIVEERFKLIKQLRAKRAEIIESRKLLGEEQSAADEAVTQNQQKLNELHAASVDDYPETKYQLCGVVTSYDTCYVRILPRKDEEDLLVDEDAEDPEPQWWRIEFTHGTPCSFSHRKVHDFEVRRAASDAREKVLLVYANPEALSTPYQPLPQALKTFVEVDNESFKLELQAREDHFEDSMNTTIEVDPAYAEPPPYTATPNWGGERDEGPPQLSGGQLPPLPPRSAQADNSSMEAGSSGGSELGGKDAGQNVTKKRGSRFTTGIKKVLSRSKSRERRTQPDLLTDNAEQVKGAATMAPNGKLAVPGSGNDDKKTKR